jgi:hypothetical protein
VFVIPRGPNGERRPSDVARIATGKDEDIGYKKPGKGGKARVKALRSRVRRLGGIEPRNNTK